MHATDPALTPKKYLQTPPELNYYVEFFVFFTSLATALPFPSLSVIWRKMNFLYSQLIR